MSAVAPCFNAVLRRSPWQCRDFAGENRRSAGSPGQPVWWSGSARSRISDRLGPYYATGSILVNKNQQLSCKYYRVAGFSQRTVNLHPRGIISIIPFKCSSYMPIGCRAGCRNEGKTHVLQLAQNQQLNCKSPAALHRNRTNLYDEARPRALRAKVKASVKRDVQWQRHIAR